jgi:DNA modification methylase
LALKADRAFFMEKTLSQTNQIQPRTIRVEYMALSELLRAPRNPKHHDINAVLNSFSRFGFVNPVIRDERTGCLVAGHGRLDALQQQKTGREKPPEGIREVSDEWYLPVVRGLEFKDDAEAEAYLVADNQTTLLGGWNEADLAAILSEHAASTRGLAGLGFDIGDLDELLRSIDQAWEIGEVHQDTIPLDKASELQRKWNTAPGQLWSAKPHRIWCGDARELRKDLFAENRIRLIWCDPPYGVRLSSKNEQLNRLDRGSRNQRAIVNDDLTAEQTGALLCDVLKAAIPYCHRGAACYTCAPAGRMLPVFIDAFDRSGFTFRWQLAWVKQSFVLSLGADYHLGHENVLYGWLGDGPHYFVDDRTKSSVFTVDRPMANDLHPSQKPLSLIAQMVANSCSGGEMVFDPFCGSGSTLVAAHQIGRVGYGVEIDPAFVAVTLERLSALGLKPELELTA